MHVIFNDLKESGRKKFLLLIPFLLVACLAGLMSFSTEVIQDLLLREKIIEIQNLVGTVNAAIDATNVEEVVESIITKTVEYVDMLPLVYAGAFQRNGNELTLITERDYATDFDPLLHQIFWDEVMNNENGSFIIGIAPRSGQGEQLPYRDIHFVYKWTPSFLDSDERYLVIAGASKYSVQVAIPAVVHLGNWFGIFAIFVLSIWLLYMIVRQALRVEKIKTAFDRYQKNGGD